MRAAHGSTKCLTTGKTGVFASYKAFSLSARTEPKPATLILSQSVPSLHHRKLPGPPRQATI